MVSLLPLKHSPHLYLVLGFIIQAVVEVMVETVAALAA
jgi:hypothetical protein